MVFTQLDCSREVAEKLWSKHAVDMYEVHEALNSEQLLLRGGRGGLWEASGRTDAGRYLLIVLRPLGPDHARLVTARDMDRAERRRYTKR